MKLLEENPAATASGTLQLSDPSQFEAAVQPWDLICSPLSSGPFSYRMAYVTTPLLTFYRETYDVGVSLKGVAPPGMLAFAVPLTVGQGSEFWNSPLNGPGLPATLPGSLDVLLTKGHDHVVVLVSLQLLHQHLPPDQVESIEAAAQERLLPSTRQGTKDFGHWLLGRLWQFVSAPELLRRGAVLRTLEHDMINRLARVLRTEKAASMRPSSSARRRALDRALNYLYGSDNSVLSVPELSQIAGASQRTLEYAFRETFSMSPRAFLIQRRLHAVRRDLLALAPHSPATVGEVAHAHGFHELGRFAGDYKRTFGELPSETLRFGRARAEQVWTFAPSFTASPNI